MKKSGFFWVSYADLMTSLFFIMLVLYVVSYALYQVQLKKASTGKVELFQKIEELNNANSKLEELNLELESTKQKLLIEAEKAKIIKVVEQNLKPLKNNTNLFKYEDKYKRFTLAFDVKFRKGAYTISNDDLENYEHTSKKIQQAGKELLKTIDHLAEQRVTNPDMKNVSYLITIAGYASKLPNNTELTEYERSYRRAYFLWQYWKDMGIDFEDKKYEGLIDLQIAGNGWGGVGRFPYDPNNSFINEMKNQRFIIQIVPKIGEI